MYLASMPSRQPPKGVLFFRSVNIRVRFRLLPVKEQVSIKRVRLGIGPFAGWHDVPQHRKLYGVA